MAIALASSSSLGNGAGSQTFSYTVSGNYLIVGVVAVGGGGGTGNDTISAASYNGTAMSMLGKTLGVNWNYLFGLATPSTGAHNIVITGTQSGGSLLTIACAADYSGVGSLGSAAIVTGVVTSTATFSKAITTVEDNCWCVMVGEGYNGNALQSAGAATTLRAQDAGFGACGLYDSNGVVHPAGSRSLIFTYGGSVAGMSGILASLAPPAPTNTFPLVS